jgi:hypothetical protein
MQWCACVPLPHVPVACQVPGHHDTLLLPPPLSTPYTPCSLPTVCRTPAFHHPPPPNTHTIHSCCFTGAKAYEKAEDPIYALEHNLPIDVQHYLDHHLTQPLMRIFEPVCKDVKAELLSGE